jgi:hypothetical protein
MLESSNSWTPWVRRPRQLSEAEARLLSVLLASPLGTEASRIPRAGVPRSTYQRLRRNIYRDGWLRDRYVPRLEVVGGTSLTFVLAFPYAEQAEEVERAWARSPRAVVVWATPEFYFAVFVGDDPSRPAYDRHLFPRSFRSLLSLSVRAGDGSVERYFDYGSAFAHLCGLAEAPTRPDGWEILAPPDHENGRRPSARLLRAARDVVVGDGATGRVARPPHLRGYTFLPRIGQEAIRRGLVRWQVTPDYRRIPAYEGRRPTDLVFVYAERRPGREPAVFLDELGRDAGIYPFLAAFDRDHALLGLLEIGPDAEDREGVGHPGRSTLVHVLGRSLVGVELFRERLSLCQSVVDHDYARLLS